MDQGFNQVFWDACASGDFGAVCAEIKKGCDITPHDILEGIPTDIL